MTKSKTAVTTVAMAAAALAILGGCSSAADETKPIEKKPLSGSSSSGGSSSGGSSSGGSSSGQDTDPTDPPCVPKDAKANDKGVGAYCDAKVRCAKGAFCTADFGAPVGAQFCTLMCNTDADCGSGSICFEEARGKGCVPSACVK